jgi:hypothetical protein
MWLLPHSPLGVIPHSPEFPCKSGQLYSNKQEGKGNRMDKKTRCHQNMSAMRILI